MLSKRIAQLRKNNGMSQAKLADLLNVSPSTIGMYEQGRRVPDMSTLISTSKIFGVSLDYLITGKESVHFPHGQLHPTVHHDILAVSNEQEGIAMIITDPTVIGTRLREIRKARKLSQAEVAAAAGISGRAFADIERGTSNMRVDTMLKICQVLFITPNKLFIHEYDSSSYEVQTITQYLSSFSVDDIEKVVELLQIVQKAIRQYG